ncbi:MAG TPA: glycosyltransferase, partial [Actinomycetota bacterium]|nr:glycosyltransferase [Actinomycetota bacterium]
GIPEVVVDGQTGLLAPPGDRIGLAARVLALLADEALRQRLGAAARERCRSSFDIRVVAPRYLELYQRLAA